MTETDREFVSMFKSHQTVLEVLPPSRIGGLVHAQLEIIEGFMSELMQYSAFSIFQFTKSIFEYSGCLKLI